MSLWGNTDTEADRPTFINLANQATGSRVIFIDESEAQTKDAKAKGIRGPGWYLFNEYEDSALNTRYRAELLVAMRVKPGDAGDALLGADDDIAPPLSILVVDPLEDDIVTAGDPASFLVTYTLDPVTMIDDVSFVWMVSEDAGVTWSVIADETTSLYAIAVTTIEMDDFEYKVIVSAPGARSVESTVGTLTVNPIG